MPALLTRMSTPPEHRRRRGHHALDLVGPAHVGRMVRHRHGVLDLQLVAQPAIAVASPKPLSMRLAPGRGQGAGDAEPDAAGGAGDDGGLAREWPRGRSDRGQGSGAHVHGRSPFAKSAAVRGRCARPLRPEMPAVHDLDRPRLSAFQLYRAVIDEAGAGGASHRWKCTRSATLSRLCETLNFTRAAEKCNVTQPSLTRAIKLLEDELGGPLFNRERNQTHLTELGQLMEPHLREVIDQSQAARARASSFFALRTARLKLGVARGVTLGALDDTIRRFVTAHPDTEIAMHDDRPSELREALRRGDFELVLLPQRTHDLDDLHYYPLGEDRLFAILPEAHRLAALDLVPLAELADESLVCGDGCPFWEAADRAFREQGISVTPKAIATRAEWLFELVGAGVGSWRCRPPHRSAAGLVSRPVEGMPPDPRDQPHHQARAAYSPPVKAFVDLALKPRPRPQSIASAA